MTMVTLQYDDAAGAGAGQWQVDRDRQRMIDSVLATVALGS